MVEIDLALALAQAFGRTCGRGVAWRDRVRGRRTEMSLRWVDIVDLDVMMVDEREGEGVEVFLKQESDRVK